MVTRARRRSRLPPALDDGGLIALDRLRAVPVELGERLTVRVLRRPHRLLGGLDQMLQVVPDATRVVVVVVAVLVIVGTVIVGGDGASAALLEQALGGSDSRVGLAEAVADDVQHIIDVEFLAARHGAPPASSARSAERLSGVGGFGSLCWGLRW